MNTTTKLMTLLLALILPASTFAFPPYSYTNYEFAVDGIYYKIVDNEACVTFQEYRSGMHMSDYHGDVIIPAQVTYQDVTYDVTTIDYYAFNYCQGLTSITIPESITTIKECAFYLCTRLACVNLLTPTVVIEKHAFSMCTALTTITCASTTPPAMYYEECFDSPHYEDATLFVPARAMESYRNAPVWKNFVHIEENSSVEVPGDENGDNEVNIADINAVIDIILTDATDLRGDVNNDGEVNIADINAIINIILGGTEVPEYEYVDLGLPSGTLWATMNVGASKPEDYGDYFAWGETTPKDIYSWSSYKWGNYGAGILSKYVTNHEYGTVDNKTELDPEDDAAYVNWGPSWRMPSMEQQNELINNCTWQWTTMNGVNGYWVTGPNGNRLFLPAAGSYEDNSLILQGGNGEYWSRTLRANLSLYAHCIHFYYGGMVLFDSTREIGYSVRAVRSPQTDIYIEQQSLDLGLMPVGETSTGLLTIVNDSEQAVTFTATVNEPFSFQQDEGNTTSMTIVVPGNSHDSVTVMFTSTTPGEFNGHVTFQSSALDGGKRNIPLHVRAFNDIIPQDEFVDLGLPSGTQWATRNIGADTPEDHGDYFAWGETAPKEVYNWTTYKWCNGTYQTITKYCTELAYGTIDNMKELEPEDDAAFVNWGPSWRIPTLAQQDELTGQCTWVWTPRNSVNGYLVIGPNGNSLFLPAASFYVNDSLWGDMVGYYWSRTLFTGNSYSAFYKNFDAESVHGGFYSFDRALGLTIRPVLVSQD